MSCPRVLHDLLVALTQALLAGGHAPLRRLAGRGSEDPHWPAGQTGIHLKGLLWSALEAHPLTLFLEGLEATGFPTYRFLQRLYYTPGMVLFATSRSERTLGALGRLFWDPRRITSA